MKHILLSKDLGGWSAKFVNDTEILELFGTDTLPTAWTRHALGSEVKQKLQLNYPCHVISILTKEEQ